MGFILGAGMRIMSNPDTTPVPEPLPSESGPPLEATEAARTLLAAIVAEHGPVLLILSGGCCDGTAPMCYPEGEFALAPDDLRIGAVDGAAVYLPAGLAPLWQGGMIPDAVPGRGGGVFSLDTGRAAHFVARSGICARR